MLQHQPQQQWCKRTNRYQCTWRMNIYAWPIMAYVQKTNHFNATLKTDFDESIGNINIIPQDIGRVLLNLINNAFYAVDEKRSNNRKDTNQQFQ